MDHALSKTDFSYEILVIDDGSIKQRGTHAELYAEGGLYRDLYETQFAGQDH
jgi:ATP-binding cassette subfamily B protein